MNNNEHQQTCGGNEFCFTRLSPQAESRDPIPGWWVVDGKSWKSACVYRAYVVLNRCLNRQPVLWGWQLKQIQVYWCLNIYGVEANPSFIDASIHTNLIDNRAKKNRMWMNMGPDEMQVYCKRNSLEKSENCFPVRSVSRSILEAIVHGKDMAVQYVSSQSSSYIPMNNWPVLQVSHVRTYPHIDILLHCQWFSSRICRKALLSPSIK